MTLLGKLIFPVTAMALFCGGCDGVYIYSYEGTLYRNDKVTPAVGVPVLVRQNSSPKNLVYAQDKRTDEQGHYRGSFVQGTGWVFALRPPAPELERVYLFTPSAESVEISLSGIDQKITGTDRHLILPAISIPSADPKRY